MIDLLAWLAGTAGQADAGQLQAVGVAGTDWLVPLIVGIVAPLSTMFVASRTNRLSRPKIRSEAEAAHVAAANDAVEVMRTVVAEMKNSNARLRMQVRRLTDEVDVLRRTIDMLNEETR